MDAQAGVGAQGRPYRSGRDDVASLSGCRDGEQGLCVLTLLRGWPDSKQSGAASKRGAQGKRESPWNRRGIFAEGTEMRSSVGTRSRAQNNGRILSVSTFEKLSNVVVFLSL